MKAVSQPGEQAGLGRRKIDARHPDLGKSKLARPVAHLGQQERTLQLTAIDHHPPIVGAPVVQTWRSEADTQQLASALAARPGIADAFITLHGELGAGKTTFVRHLLRAMGVAGRIKSPTYAVVEPHEAAGARPVWHFDFYRFDDPREWEDAGFRDVFAGPGLKLAEWPEKAGAVLPLADLAIHLDPQADESRIVTLRANTPRGRELLA
jgi:tRNA threonylcarbamoyladenosine biosynthesis protein TsaE